MFLENLPKVRTPFPTFSALFKLPKHLKRLPTASLPPWSFLPMGIGEPHCVCLALVIFDLRDALVWRRLHLGDALPWRRFLLATLALGVSSPRRRLVLTLTPGVDFDLDFVNARIRDGTVIMRPKRFFVQWVWSIKRYMHVPMIVYYTRKILNC